MMEEEEEESSMKTNHLIFGLYQPFSSFSSFSLRNHAKPCKNIFVQGDESFAIDELLMNM